MKLKFPHQVFIDNEFVDSSDGATYNTINPADETVSSCFLKNSFDI